MRFGLNFSGNRVFLGRSPLARRIVLFNLLAMLVMGTGVLYLSPFRNSLVYQREQSLRHEVDLIADVVAERMHQEKQGCALARLSVPNGSDIYLFAPGGGLICAISRASQEAMVDDAQHHQPTPMSDLLARFWAAVNFVGANNTPRSDENTSGIARSLVDQVRPNETCMVTRPDATGAVIFSVARGIYRNDQMMAVVAMTTASGEIDRLVRIEREQVLQMFVLAILVSVGLSLALASTIATPLADLTRAVEAGQYRNSRKIIPSRINIPDMTGRPDEIGRLSVAMRAMVTAFYDRISANEQFAADVAHEIKNPLASLGSAVGALQVVSRPEQRDKLVEIMKTDINRMDRLVSDISNASRLDSELVLEQQQQFDLTLVMRTLARYMGDSVEEKDITLMADLPDSPINILGLESRLVQVFRNLLVNAISFCSAGDTVRIWMRRVGDAVHIVVEDTGPGIPDDALERIFDRFYSHRPNGRFGNHSGLGLAISRQIVESHGGRIWAENVTDGTGARFTVVLPL